MSQTAELDNIITITKVAAILVNKYNYTLEKDLIDGGLNAIELKSNDENEHLIIFNLDQQEKIQYFIATVKNLTPIETAIKKLLIQSLVDSIIDKYFLN